MTFTFDGGKVLRCEACGFRMYLGPWDLYKYRGRIWMPIIYTSCIPCGGEMVETHVGRADGWEEIEAVPA